MGRLESPQKEQFISLFIDLKTKNVFKLGMHIHLTIQQ